MMRVFLNPGHDLFCDPGACGCGLEEATVVYDICKLVEKYLKAANVEVSANVQDDDLRWVCSTANQYATDIFVSVHCNSAASEYATGTETFALYSGGLGDKLAHCVQSQIVRSLGTVNRGVKYANFYVLVHTDMPAILVETAFICNPNDAELLRNKKDEFARAIARGITDYQKSIQKCL